jgi:ATP-binding cassette subfamily C protein
LDNISGGADISEEDAWRAADAASIGDEIRAMPMKLNSLVSTSTFSGGQAQRILIARALARDPKILLFDEATSALDNESQDVVMESISKLDLTRVVIAHRLSTVMNADRILLIADGQLLEEGTYRSLMDQDGLFAKLAKRQLS